MTLSLTRGVHALAFWVDYDIVAGAKSGSEDRFSQNPFDGHRHGRQCLLFLETPIQAKQPQQQLTLSYSFDSTLAQLNVTAIRVH